MKRNEGGLKNRAKLPAECKYNSANECEIIHTKMSCCIHSCECIEMFVDNVGMNDESINTEAVKTMKSKKKKKTKKKII